MECWSTVAAASFMHVHNNGMRWSWDYFFGDDEMGGFGWLVG
jgi:hypothetical protein